MTPDPPPPPRPAPEAAPAGGADAPAPRRRRGYFLPGFIAMAVLVAIGVAVGAGDLAHPAPRTLAGADVASEIALGIESAQGLHQPSLVSCPATEPVRLGQRFTCRETGSPAPIAVIEIDNRGHLRWSFGPAGS